MSLVPGRERPMVKRKLPTFHLVLLSLPTCVRGDANGRDPLESFQVII